MKKVTTALGPLAFAVTTDRGFVFTDEPVYVSDQEAQLINERLGAQVTINDLTMEEQEALGTPEAPVDPEAPAEEAATPPAQEPLPEAPADPEAPVDPEAPAE